MTCGARNRLSVIGGILRLQIILTIGLIFLAGCSRKAKDLPALVEPYSPSTGSVGFEATPSSPLSDGTVVWTAVYTSREGTTRFQIKLNPTKTNKDDPSIGFGTGSFVTVPGSQSAPLLNALKVALEAKHLPQNTSHTQNLPFTFANLGTGLIHDKNGGFDLKSHGSWTAMKIFLESPDSTDEAEVFLNLSPSTQKGEFSIKDPDYGDDVLKQLARVF
jgi:hypothetical protein